MIEKLEKAIRELELQKQALLDEIQKYGWKDERSNEKIPESRELSSDLMDLFDKEKVIPEKAPLPPNAGSIYQQWYSAGRAILTKNQPDRLAEFDKIYSSIKHMLQERYLTKNDQLLLMDRVNTQFDLLMAIPSHLRFSMYDIELEAYSILMEDELEASRYLLLKGFLRPAGVLAGVILERHLKNILRKHTLPIKIRKNITLASLNELCKDSVYDLVTWRKIQHLTDLRNLCAHDKTREPKKDEVTELINGVSGILRSYNINDGKIRVTKKSAY